MLYRLFRSYRQDESRTVTSIGINYIKAQQNRNEGIFWSQQQNLAKIPSLFESNRLDGKGGM
ncbi:hypothetical protein [Alkalimarinus coralli]|uniref:hypothetical protein n=1 Tax=Alkalimarinus coralli TaxID=2935863 RepID=UPI00202AE77C|nr:hypothetical protein [Alkalimarinus coralli]